MARAHAACKRNTVVDLYITTVVLIITLCATKYAGSISATTNIYAAR